MKTRNLIRTLILAGTFLLHLGALCSHSHGAAGDVDLSFDAGSGVNNQVRLIVPQADGKMLIAGEFSTVRGLRRIGIARINPDGTGDATFDAGSAGTGRYFTSLALEPDGNVLLGAEDGLIRLEPDGGAETLINIPTYEKICKPWGCAYGIGALAVQADGNILIGGNFRTDNGAATNYGIARILPDGTLDSGFNATVAPDEEDMPTSEGVSAINLLPDGKLVIAGFFSRINGEPRQGIARLHPDGRLDESFNATGAISGNVGLAQTQADGKVLVAGTSFTTTGVNPVLARLNTDGSLDTGFHFDRSLLHSLWTIVPQPDGSILVAGTVNTFGWEGRRLIRLLPDGSLDQTFDAPAAGGVMASIRGLAVQSDGTIVIGGQVSGVGELRRTGLARLHPDGSLDAGFRADSGLSGIQRPGVRSIAVQADGMVIIGGSWIRFAGLTVFGIARLHPDGMLDPTFSPQDPGNIVAMALQPDGKILIGEDLRWLEGPSRPAVSRLLPGGEPDIVFRAELSDVPLPDDCPHDGTQDDETCSESFSVTAVAALTDGRILVGGFRTTIVCNLEGNCWTIQRPFVARLHADGTYDGTFSVSQFGTGGELVRSLMVQPDGRILVAGYFKVIDGQARPGVARLNPDGSPDGSFDVGMPVAGESVDITALALQADGRILLGKYIFTSEEILRHEMTRLNHDGSLDATFNTGGDANGSVHSIAVQPDGKIILAGDFTRVGGVDHHRVARLHPLGSVDDSFDPGLGADAAVYAMATPPDGSLFIGGEFNSYNLLARPGVAKLHVGPRSSVPFATWVARFGLSGPAAAAGADPDRDGLPNAAEFILGGNPTEAATSGRPTATTGGGDLIFAFSRDDASETPDVTLTVETGTGLVTWPAVFIIGSDTATSSPGVTVTENGSAPDAITVTIPRGTATSMFARLKVTITL